MGNDNKKTKAVETDQPKDLIKSRSERDALTDDRSGGSPPCSGPESLDVGVGWEDWAEVLAPPGL